MIISLIVAMDEKGGISHHGQLPWHLPAELRLFKQTTIGHHLLMGRKTFETIGRSLPGRTIIVITRQAKYQAGECQVAHSIEDGFTIARSRAETELFVCGGRDIYEQTLPLSERIYLTQVHTIADTDLSFPRLDLSVWYEIKTTNHPADEKNEFAFTQRIFDKKPLLVVDKP